MKKHLSLSLLTIILFFGFCNGQQGTSGNIQDSIAKEQLKVDKFLDSLQSHTSIKEFSIWLDENVSGKTYREGKFQELYNLFVQQKYQLWIQQRSQPKKPKN